VQTTRTVNSFTKTIIVNIDENIVWGINKKLLSADLCNANGLSQMNKVTQRPNKIRHAVCHVAIFQ